MDADTFSLTEDEVHVIFGMDEEEDHKETHEEQQVENKRAAQQAALTAADWQTLKLRVESGTTQVGECRVWQGKTLLISLHKMQFTVKRIVFQLKTGVAPWPESVMTTSCNNSSCAAQAHIFELLPVSAPLEVRITNYKHFMRAKSLVDDKTGCWLWQGAPAPNGYGSAPWEQKTDTAHRLAFMLWNNALDLPSTTQVLHDKDGKKCTSRLCCNPEHLHTGTAQDNADDDEKTGTRKRGAAVHRAKLTEAQAQQIKDSKGNGLSLRLRGAPFSASKVLVLDIDTGKTWAHLPYKGQFIHAEAHRAHRKWKTDKRRKRLEEGFQEVHYKATIDRIFKKAILLMCNELIGSDLDQALEPCRLLKNTTNGLEPVRVEINNVKRTCYITVAEYFHNDKQLLHTIGGKPNGLLVRHLCQPVPGFSCCASTHLRIGTAADNRQDMLYYGTSTMSLPKAQRLRDAASAGEGSVAQLAADFQTTPAIAKSIIHGDSWSASHPEFAKLVNNADKIEALRAARKIAVEAFLLNVPVARKPALVVQALP